FQCRKAYLHPTVFLRSDLQLLRYPEARLRQRARQPHLLHSSASESRLLIVNLDLRCVGFLVQWEIELNCCPSSSSNGNSNVIETLARHASSGNRWRK